MIGSFSYFRPKNIIDAAKALALDGAFSLAGGTDILVNIRNGKLDPTLLVDLKGLKELYGIEDQGENIRLGPLTTMNQVVESPLLSQFTALQEGAKVLGCHGIRNRATIGGNICNASPSGDGLIPLLIFDPILVIKGLNGERKLSIGDFYKEKGKTALTKGEILTDVLIPKRENCKSIYKRKTRVKGMDLSSIGLGISLTPVGKETYDVRLAFGAVASKPTRMKEAEKILSSKALSSELIDQASEAVNNVISPREESLRGTPQYKRAMVKVLLKDSILELVGGGDMDV
jgi:carbon-monoxide dehydrogenase medium subunit